MQSTIKFYSKLGGVLRYSVSGGAGPGQLTEMLKQFQSREHAINRMGGPTSDHTIRQQLADAIQEQDTGSRPGAELEVQHLLNPDQHVMVHEGRVVPARYTPTLPLSMSYYNAQREAEQNPSFIIPYSGYHSHLQNTGIDDLPYGTINASNGDNYIYDDTRSEFHFSRLGEHLANLISSRVPKDFMTSALQAKLEELRNAPFEEPVPETN